MICDACGEGDAQVYDSFVQLYRGSEPVLTDRGSVDLCEPCLGFIKEIWIEAQFGTQIAAALQETAGIDYEENRKLPEVKKKKVPAN